MALTTNGYHQFVISLMTHKDYSFGSEEELDVIPSSKTSLNSTVISWNPKEDKDSLEATVKLVETSGPVSK